MRAGNEQAVRSPSTEKADHDDRIEPAEPIDRIEPAEPIDRIEPAEPIDRIEPADPIDSRLPALSTERSLAEDRIERSLSLLNHDRWAPGWRSRPTMAAWYRGGSAGSGPPLGSPAVAATAPVLRRSLKGKGPSLTVERGLWAEGHRTVVGIDEVGRGSWAGPLTIGAAVLPADRRVYKVRDSKALTEREREALFDRIAGWCVTWSVGHASHRECDDLGMSEAQRLAARRAIAGLGVEPDQVLLDGKWDFVGSGNVTRIVKGDARCLSISAASILAKVTRDRIMRAEADHYPGYDFEFNKGYPCPRHRVALRGIGPSAIHRRSWAFMDDLPWNGVRRQRPVSAQGSLFDD